MTSWSRTKRSTKLSYFPEKWSGRDDSNIRPPAPHAGALAKLRYAPTKNCRLLYKTMTNLPIFYSAFTFRPINALIASFTGFPLRTI